MLTSIVACVICYIAGGLSWAGVTRWLKSSVIPEIESEVAKGTPELKAAYEKLKVLL